MVTDIGFLSEMEPNWNIWDSTKVGGKPVWLNPEYIPEPILCKHCNSPMMFLLQVYSVTCLRTSILMWFVSLELFALWGAGGQLPPCHLRVYLLKAGEDRERKVWTILSWFIWFNSCVALRCQLPHDNKYYHSDEESHYTGMRLERL